MQKKHLLSSAIRDISNILQNSQFYLVNSPTIDIKENCFDKLLMNDHICLSTKDTFFITKTNDKDYVLRPHCSNFQNIVFKKNKNEIKNKIKLKESIYFYTIGKVFRKDKSSKHSYFFHQFDGLIFKNQNNIFELIKIILKIIFKYLEYHPKYLIRESYFPFTYPSYEIDIWHNNQWIEILGCGITHTQILKNFQCLEFINKTFAFGVGIERLVMIKHNINNIHKLQTM